ncbi:unnamed protein product, partial [Protopolystoma xenopodis]
LGIVPTVAAVSLTSLAAPRLTATSPLKSQNVNTIGPPTTGPPACLAPSHVSMANGHLSAPSLRLAPGQQSQHQQQPLTGTATTIALAPVPVNGQQLTSIHVAATEADTTPTTSAVAQQQLHLAAG